MEPFLRYLGPKEKYEERYDRQTIKGAQIYFEGARKSISSDKLKEIKEDMTDEQKIHEIKRVMNVYLYFYKGDRWKKRASTIKEWMDADRDRDDRYEHAWETAEPNLKRTCEHCGCRRHKVMEKVFMHKQHDKDFKGGEFVLFVYECLKCQKRSAEFADGDPYDFNKYCPDCESVLEDKQKRYKHKIVFRDICPKCPYSHEWEMDLREKKEKKKTKAELKKEQEEYEQFERDRKELCLTDKEGEEYLEAEQNLNQLNELMKEQKHKEDNKALYDKAANTERINIFEAQKRMKASIKKSKFTKLKFEDPNMGTDITCEFRVYETDPNREEKQACKDLEALIGEAFDNTNWKLMSDGISYRMGILKGLIRGLEKEKDILKNTKL